MSQDNKCPGCGTQWPIDYECCPMARPAMEVQWLVGRDPVWDAMKKYSKDKFDSDRKRFLADAVSSDDGGWTKHTEYHWSRMVAGSKLDYWPSRKKWQWRGKVQRGDVASFIKRKERA